MAAPVVWAASMARAISERIREGPGGIVDQHDVGRESHQRFEAGQHRRLPRRAAEDGRGDRHAGHRRVKVRDIVRMNDNLCPGDPGMGGKGGDAAGDHRASAKLAILLGSAIAGPQPASGGNDQGGG